MAQSKAGFALTYFSDNIFAEEQGIIYLIYLII